MWHSGVLTMLTAGATASGRLSHELIANVKAKYSYRSDKAIRAIWKKYKAQIMAGDGFRIERVRLTLKISKVRRHYTRAKQ